MCKRSKTGIVSPAGTGVFKLDINLFSLFPDTNSTMPQRFYPGADKPTTEMICLLVKALHSVYTI